MIRNSIIDLQNKSEVRKDAKGILKYGLMLDYTLPNILPEETEGKKIIDKILIQTRNCCHSVFSSTSTCATYRFFGTLDHSLDHTNIINMKILDDYKFGKSTPCNENEIYPLTKMILDQCVIHSYHMLLTDLFSNTPITFYNAYNKLNTNGFQSLISKKIISLENDTLKVKRKEIYGDADSKQLASNATNFKNKIKRKANINNIFFNCIYSGEHFLSFPLLPFTHCLKEIEPKYLKAIFNHENINQHTLNEAFESINSIIFNGIKYREKKEKVTNSIFDTSKNKRQYTFSKYLDIDNRFKTDIIYRYYLCERIFGTNLLNSLLQQVKYYSNTTGYKLQYDLELLSLCNKLPNVFSRNYFLMYALDAIDKNTDSFRDFWQVHDLSIRDFIDGVMPRATRKSPHGFNYHKWTEQFRDFINLMSIYIFPIFEWCFVSMLMDVLEKVYPAKSHKSRLYDGINWLDQYINAHYLDILRPITLNKSKQKMLDPSDTFSLFGIDISEEQENDFFNFYYSHTNFDLNITPLNTAFFKEHHAEGSHYTDHLRDIQNFYLDLIRYDHFK